MSNFLFWMENMEINLLDNISPDWRRGEGSTLILLIVPKVAHVQMLLRMLLSSVQTHSDFPASLHIEMSRKWRFFTYSSLC